MPWKKLCLIGERLRFVKVALKAQQPMGQVCRIFQISRRVGYKWLKRFLREGRRGLQDRSRRPGRSPKTLPRIWRKRVRRLRRRHPHWGAKKIGVCLRRRFGWAPAERTVALWLCRMKLVKRRRRRAPAGPKLEWRGLTKGRRPNQVWTVDFKGWFRSADGKRLEPLTVRDLFSRYVLTVCLLSDQSWRPVQAVFVRLFRRHGLPRVIRVDNGGPFASSGAAGLSRLSAWWTALGIRVEFTRPGHPQDNGAHEQFHRVFKAEITRPPSSSKRAQQRRIHRWLRVYNHQRPHEGVGQRIPANLYRVSVRVYPERLEEWKYRAGWERRRVRHNGQIRWRGRLRFIGEAFVGHRVGLKPLSNGQHQVYLGPILIGELRASDAGGLRPAAYARQRPTKGKKRKM